MNADTRPDSTAPLVSYEIQDSTAILKLNRPAARNAINPELARAIEGAVDRAEQDDAVWTIVLTSSGHTFCAGADLKAVASGEYHEIFTERGGFAGFAKRLRTKPAIAAIEGAALAGGCEIALACDLIVASTDAKFGLPEVQRSLVATAGGVFRLPRVLPRNIAMQMVLTGEPINASTAAHHGMVNELTAPGQALPRALALATQINAAAPIAVRASRSAFLRCLDASEADGWHISWQETQAVFETEDFKEGPRAFVEKRPPVWQAR